MAALPEPPPVEVKERLQRFDMLLQHLHRLRANLAVDNTMPSALRELHKLQALQMLNHQQQHQRHHPHRRPQKHFHGGVLPLLPPLPPLLSPQPDPRRLPYIPPGFSPLPHKQQQQHLTDEPVIKQKCEWEEPTLNGNDIIHRGVVQNGVEMEHHQHHDEDLDVTMAVTNEDDDHDDVTHNIAAVTSNDVPTNDVVTPKDAVTTEESEDDIEDDETVHDLLAEEILAESKEVQEETENLASENGDELSSALPFLPPIMNIELIKVKSNPKKYFFLFLLYYFVFFII